MIGQLLKVKITVPGSMKFEDCGNLLSVSDVDRNSVKIAKQVIQAPEYKLILGAASRLRRYLITQCIQVAPSIYFVPPKSQDEVESKLNDFRTTWDSLVSDFLNVYSSLQESAKTRLGSLFNPNDYPNAFEIVNKFEYSYSWIVFPFEDPSEPVDFPENTITLTQLVTSLRTSQLAQEFVNLTQKICAALHPSGEGRTFRKATWDRYQQVLNEIASTDWPFTDNVVKTQAVRVLEATKGMSHKEAKRDCREDLFVILSDVRAFIGPAAADSPIAYGENCECEVECAGVLNTLSEAVSCEGDAANADVKPDQEVAAAVATVPNSLAEEAPDAVAAPNEEEADDPDEDYDEEEDYDDEDEDYDDEDYDDDESDDEAVV